jgi:hypothetical protein
LPIPLLLPVTIATLPCNRFIVRRRSQMIVFSSQIDGFL